MKISYPYSSCVFLLSCVTDPRADLCPLKGFCWDQFDVYNKFIETYESYESYNSWNYILSVNRKGFQ